MKKICLLFILLVTTSYSQNFPYLNASTGNPDFFTDKDTNMFFIHGNRLAKVTKNFVPVWVKTYGSLSLKKILLSKTGSMYFIAVITPISLSPQSLIGKIEANGNISWMKSTVAMPVTVAGSTVTSSSLNAESFFLDSNNNLLLSGAVSSVGNAGFIKMDTLGNFIKARLFSVSDYSVQGGSIISFNILNEASGLINFISTGSVGGGAGTVMNNFSYSDGTDSISYANKSGLAGCNNCISGFGATFYKSKTRSDVFYLFGATGIGQPSYSNFILLKYTMNSMMWEHAYRWSGAPATVGVSLDEDEKGNVFGVINTTTSMSSHHSGFVKFDSTGAFNGNWIKYFTDYNPNSVNYPTDRVNVVHYNRYIMNVVGNGYPTNPITIENISSALTMSCANTVSLTYGASAGSSTFSISAKPTQYTINSLSMANVSPTVNAVTTFSIAQSFCATVNVTENELFGLESVSVYPNPSGGIITVSTTEKSAKVELYTINGALVYSAKCLTNKHDIDLSKFENGIYFLRCGPAVKKIVKE